MNREQQQIGANAVNAFTRQAIEMIHEVAKNRSRLKLETLINQICFNLAKSSDSIVDAAYDPVEVKPVPENPQSAKGIKK